MQKYIVTLYRNGAMSYTQRMKAFTVEQLEKKIYDMVVSYKFHNNNMWNITGMYEYREYTKRDYLIDIIEEALKEPQEVNSGYMADEILELLAPEE